MEDSIEKARFNMIQQQVRPWEVLDERVLEVMAAVARERFVPDAYRSLAYADIEVPIAEGQSMLAPKVVGRLLQALAIGPDDRCLEIGTGTGYVTACLAGLGRRVVSLEIHQALADQAQANLEDVRRGRLEIRQGDGLSGPVDGHPFDVIAVTGSLPDEEALPALQDQLALGGRMFVVVGTGLVMTALLITRVTSSGFRRQGLFETSIPALEGVPEPEAFVF
jgi:protein-L-isoaspartate(D-aspartate) O-methyltransferase